jgi:WD40 repeat protein/serine/threonine protein kinase
MYSPSLDRFNQAPLTVRMRVDALCCEFEEELRAGRDPKLESYLGRLEGPHQAALFTELLSLELEYRRSLGQTPQEATYAGRFPPYDAIVREAFRTRDGAKQPLGDPDKTAIDGHKGPTLRSAPARLPTVTGFEILAELGRGGMGVVYKARQLPLQRLVALKMILAGNFAHPDQLVRFVIEGEMLACLQHPNIVQVHEVGQHEGRPFLALEFVEGGTLDDYLASRPVPPREAARLLEPLARAVHYAHLQGIIHRDLKPANILLQEDQTTKQTKNTKEEEQEEESTSSSVRVFRVFRGSLIPKITDFGLARSVHRDVKLTQSGLVAGTPSYMAPEQARGEKNLGPAVDIYALGAILYELLAGRPPFKADTPLDTIRAALEQEASRPSLSRPGVPIDLETICLKCLEKEPARRYPSAEALAEDLRRWLAGEPITARPVKTLERLWKWSRRHPGLAGSLAVIGLLIVSIAIGSAIAAARFHGIAREKGELADQREIERDKALKAREQERWERYRANIMTAVSALELNNTNIAQEALATAPEEHRNWEWRYLESQLDRASAVLPGHLSVSGAFRDIPLSPDGRHAVLWDEKGLTVRLWDVPAGKQVAALPHATPITVLARRPDGGQIAIGSEDGSARLWEPYTNRQPVDLARHPSPVCELVYSPDGRRLLSRDLRTSFRLWDATTGKQLAVLGAEKTRCVCARFTADSRGVVGGGGKEICLWDAATGQKVTVLARYDHDVNWLLELSPNGSRVAFNFGGQTVFHMWDLAAGKEVALRGHTVRPDSLAFSPDGARLATGGSYPDNTVRLWDVATGRSLPLRGHKNFVDQLHFRSDGRRLASVSGDHTVRLWDGVTGQPVATLAGHTGRIHHVAFSADGKRVVTAASDRTLRLWDAESGKLIAVLRGHTGDVWKCTFVGGGKLLLSAAADQTYRVWDIGLAERTGILSGHDSFVYDAAFRPDGAQVASASWDGTVRLWDPVTGQQSAELQHGHTVVTSLAYRPDGKQLATVTNDNRMHLWDLAARKELDTNRLWNQDYWAVPHRPAYSRQGDFLAMATGPGRIGLWDPLTARSLGELQAPAAQHSPPRFCDLAFHPDGTQLAAGGDDQLIHVWDVARRIEIATLSGHRQSVYRLTFSPAGSLLASGAFDHTVRLWDTRSARELAVLPCDSNVYGLAFTPDGTRLAVGCADNTIRLWDVARRKQVAELRGHNAYVHALAFSPDGTQLVSGSGDWTVRIWDSLKPAERARRRHK